MKGIKRKRSASEKTSSRAPPADAVDELVNALSVISTAASAMVRSQDQEGKVRRADVCEELATLQHGVGMLRKSVDAIQVVRK